jgi:hypothetical protein
MIFDRIKLVAPPGTIIPKPEAKENFYVKSIGIRRDEKALIYTIPNHNKPQSPYKKGITVSEFEKAYQRLTTSGEFTKKWFIENLPECHKEGSCNFTTIGGLFILLGEAIYAGKGVYRQVSRR